MDTIVKNIDRQIGLVVNARGGSSIELWEKDGTDLSDTLYSKTMERAIEAKKWGKYKAVLWHQGEADYWKIKNGFDYKAKLIKLVTDIRKDIGDENLYFVAGEISQWKDENKPINDILNSTGSFLNNADCVSSEGLRNLYGKLTPYDGIQEDDHYNRESLKILGQRYAKVVIDNIYKIEAGVYNNNNNMDNDIHVYLSVNSIHINYKNDNAFCSVFNIMGCKIYEVPISGNTELRLYSKGVFFVELLTENKKYIYKVLIK